MLKLQHTQGGEYEVLGQITFDNDGIEQTNYTIVVDGETITVESTDSEWLAIEVEDVAIELEPDPEPEPEIEIEPTPEELAALEKADAKRLWLRKKSALKEMISDMRDMQALGATVTPEKLTLIQTLAAWCDANVKEEYYL